ncbi:hypothetical protein DPMN_094100 [Dreissena polymorpha]|uniref:Uncharacterized protein n=1 Tax=Dreissena polymorpha TaxID=45954 RepID=A0A9D4L4H4_DREPO|nr:hypothetical protein DPMN_094100 [Dreissena polymorpha]
MKKTAHPTANEATEAQDVVRRFFQATPNTDREIQMLCSLTRNILRHQFREANGLRQSEIFDFAQHKRD